MSEDLIRRYYDYGNQRRFKEAAALFADDAQFEPPFGETERARDGYPRFMNTWLRAFPSGRLTIDRIEPRGDTLVEVYAFASGQHEGMLDLGPYHFRPTGIDTVLHIRELLDVRDGSIVLSAIAIDFNNLVMQLVKVDYRQLTDRLERIWALREQLARAIGDESLEHKVIRDLGAEIDAARRTLRPYFSK